MIGSLTKRLARASLLGLAACGDPHAGQYVGDIITATGFEQQAGWGADLAALTQQQVHAGRWATLVGPTREFSLTYHLPLGQASVHTIKAVELDAWVYLPSGKADAVLAVQVQGAAGGSGPALLYDEQLRLLDQVHDFGSWQRVHKVFVLPWNLPGEAELRIFMWRSASPEPVYLDDLTVKARE